MKSEDLEWSYSPLYRGPKTDLDESLHPILQSHVLNRDKKKEIWAAYSDFKVTKLPPGDPHDSFEFVPKKNLTTHSRRSRKSEEQLHQEQVDAFKKKEAKLAGAKFDETPQDPDLG